MDISNLESILALVLLVRLIFLFLSFLFTFHFLHSFMTYSENRNSILRVFFLALRLWLAAFFMGLALR